MYFPTKDTIDICPIESYICYAVLNCFSHVWIFAVPQTVVCQAPLSMGLSRQEYWVGCYALLQGIFLTQGLHCIALAGGFFTTSAAWEAQKVICQRLCFMPLALLLWRVIPTFLNVCISTYINIYIKFSFCSSNYPFHLL